MVFPPTWMKLNRCRGDGRRIRMRPDTFIETVLPAEDLAVSARLGSRPHDEEEGG